MVFASSEVVRVGWWWVGSSHPRAVVGMCEGGEMRLFPSQSSCVHYSLTTPVRSRQTLSNQACLNKNIVLIQDARIGR